MIYPKKISSKKIDKFLNIFSFCMIMISILLIIINKLTTPSFYWSYLCILGFIYVFLTVRYSMTKIGNISGYVLFQTILLSGLAYLIDYNIGFSGWSINISFPIIIIISNIMMFILTLINHRDFGKYAINQLIIVLLSLSTIYLIFKGFAQNNVLINISIIISIVNFLVSLALCFKDFKEEIIRKFNF